MSYLKFKRSLLKRLLFVGNGRKRTQLDGEVLDESSSSSSSSNSSVVDSMPQKPTWKCFPYTEISMATNGFHQDNLVGRGGYAEVYRGKLENGQMIAVKRMTTRADSTEEKREKEFLTELGTVGHVKHPNICTLLGCSIDLDLHLIFEFSSNGSVSSLLHDENLPTMTWKLRYKIAVGTARGLQYLHKVCKRRIIHRDIKASNILLTSDFEPQISDFGLARWLPTDWSHRAVSPIEGTFGYLAPEYFTHGIVDEKIDVFAFGVFLLEILTGRKPVDGSHQSLLAWSKPHLNLGAVEKLVDPNLGGDYDFQQLNRVYFAASICVRAAARRRPSMTEVLEILGDGEIMENRWMIIAEEVEDDEEEELWGFDELEEVLDNDALDTSFSSLSSTECS